MRRLLMLVANLICFVGLSHAQDLKPTPPLDVNQNNVPTQPSNSSASGAAAGSGGSGLEESDPRLYEGVLNRGVQLPGAVDARVYRIGPGDMLLLQLWGRVSRSIPIEVGPEGIVMIPGAGPVKVDGRTLADVREEIDRRALRRSR